MTEEVDPRLVALGLVPPSSAAPAHANPFAQPLTPTQPNPFAEPASPESDGGLFANMGKFTGMPFEAEPAPPTESPMSQWVIPSAPEPASPQWTTPSQHAAAAPPWTTPSHAPEPAAPPWTTPSQAPAPAAPQWPTAPEAPAAPQWTEPAPPPITATPHVYTPPVVKMPPPYAPPVKTPPPYTPPYVPSAVAPAAPETPTREAPPPLPPLASAVPTAAKAVEAPAIPTKKEKAKKPVTEKPAKPAKAKPAKPEKLKPPPKPRFVLPPSGVLLRGPIVMGYPEKKLQITLEQLGFRINAEEPIDVAWTDVRDIKARRGRVVVRTKGRPIAFGIPVEGVSEPTLAGPLARVVKEASGGSLDLAGSSFLELQNATDSLRDHFHDEDDPLVPTVVGLVFGLAGLTFTAMLPDALAIATRSPIAPGSFLLDYPLSGIDPRVLAAAFAAAGMLAAGIVRVAMGKAATAWARGTLRGWHEAGRKPIDLARRALASIVLGPATAAAVLLVSIVLCLPSLRVQTIIDESGFHIMTMFPLFDDNRAWSSVTNVTEVSAPTTQHFEGIAVVFTFKDKGPVSTLDGRLRGGSDRQLITSAAKWREEHGAP